MDTSAKETTAIPETGKAGVVVNPGPNFSVVIEDVSVPKPGQPHQSPTPPSLSAQATQPSSHLHRPRRSPPTAKRNRDLLLRHPPHARRPANAGNARLQRAVARPRRRGRGRGAGLERQELARRRPRRRQARLRRLLQLRAVLEHAGDALSAELADGAAAPRHVSAVYCHSGAVYDAHPGWRR